VALKADEYQELAGKTAVYPAIGGDRFLYPALGLADEAGEVLGKIKKYYRDGTPFHELREQIRKELGDVQWYVAMLARELGFTLSEIMGANVGKLADRMERGVLQGSGDNR
jgi:NTP pyrophosphatase (non-canonical NTP hydrolase)